MLFVPKGAIEVAEDDELVGIGRFVETPKGT
jgi:hypothetical protein